MSEQVNNTEKAINEKANSEPMIRILKKVLQTPSATYAAKSKKAGEQDIQDIQDNLAERLDAVRILQQMGKDAKPMVPELIEIVKQDDTELAAEAALALGSAGLTEEQVKEAVPVLITALTKPRKAEKNDNLKRDERSMLEDNIALTLSKIGKPSVSALIPLLSVDQNEEIQILAMQILNVIGADAQEAAPHLLLLLDSDKQELEFISAITLLSLKTQQEKALPVLVKSINQLPIKDADEFSKKKAVYAAQAISKSYSDESLSLVGNGPRCCIKKKLSGHCEKTYRCFSCFCK